jgi:RNA polymerase sigma factor (sigma-70 family)
MSDGDASMMGTSPSRPAAAFLDVLRQHGQAIHAYLVRRCGRDAADDLLSEVFLRAYAARREYDNRRPDPRPWLYGIARNVLREHWRRTARDPDAEALACLAAADDPWSEVDARLDAAAQLSALRRALGRLAPPDREVLLLVAWEGLTPADAAVSLGIPSGTARSRLHRARAVMRRYLDDEAATRAAASYQEA